MLFWKLWPILCALLPSGRQTLELHPFHSNPLPESARTTIGFWRNSNLHCLNMIEWVWKPRVLASGCPFGCQTCFVCSAGKSTHS